MRHYFFSAFLALLIIVSPAAAHAPLPEELLGETAPEESCIFCHTALTRKMYANTHGDARVSCLSCHSFLIHELKAGETAEPSFFQPVRAETCARCHQREFTDWHNGLHLTPWKMFRSRLVRLLRRDRVQTFATGAEIKVENPCLNCHHPHGD